MDEKIRCRTKPAKSFRPMPDDDLIICRCEEITKGEIRKAVYDGMLTLNEIKRFLRPGMGLCQGMICERNVKVIVARELGLPLDQLADTTPRSPARPVSLRDLGNEQA